MAPGSVTSGHNCFAFSGPSMAALIAIALFIVVIFALNVLEFGRLD